MPSRPRRIRVWSQVALVCVILVAGAGVLLHRSPRRSPNVILYVIDTLRADHLSAYGYGRRTSPQIDAFAREAVLFRRAYAQASWTKPSIASLFTGLFPSRHGALDKEHRIRPDVPSFIELIQRSGYTAAAFMSNPNVLPTFGFGRGFDEVMDIGARAWAEGRPAARAQDVHAEVFRYLDRVSEPPFLLYIHVLDPHQPYAAPYGPFRKAFFEEDQQPKSRGRVVSKYDGEVAYVDDVFASLLSRLKQDGLYENAIIAVLSDHGEEFWEHGGTGHGHTLFEEQLWVPLIVRLPGGAHGGRSVEQPVRVLDLMPTVTELLGLEMPGNIDGISFASLLDGREETGSYDPPLYAELSAYGHAVTSLIDDGYKLIRRSQPAERRGEVLYRLGGDEREQEDLALQEPERMLDLTRRLDAVESSLFGGIHIELRNGLNPSAVHRLEGRIESLEGRLVGITILDHQQGFRVAPDRRSIVFNLTLKNRPVSFRQDPPLVMDVARIRLESAGAALRLSVRVDGAALGSDRVLLGGENRAGGGWPLVIPLQDPHLQLERSGLLGKTEQIPTGSPYCVVYSVPLPTSQAVKLDETVRERLRALGYEEER